MGGHTVSALIGVSVAKEIHSVEWGAAIAVGLAIGAMPHLECVQPPGGATDLVAICEILATRQRQ
ncbi:MAG: HPP family protein [Acidimicrobiia bacterium]